MKTSFIKVLLASALMIVAAGLKASAQTDNVEFRGNECRAEVARLIKAAGDRGGSAAERAGAAADLLAGKAYAEMSVADPAYGPLEICLDSMNALGLVEYSIAASRASFEPLASEQDFVRELLKTRYRRGENNGFTSRLRYASDWIADNAYRNSLREVTFDLPGNVSTSRTLDGITRHRELYPALADSATFERMQMLEMGYRVHKIPYMKRESIGKKNVLELLRDNDIIVILDRSSDSDLLDAGFLRIVDGKPYLLHASQRDGRVVVDAEPLGDMMKLRAKEIAGYRVLRIKD